MKLHYDVNDDKFSYHTSADSLPWNPLVLTRSQKDVMFQWLEKERYELFKKLVVISITFIQHLTIGCLAIV